MKTAKAFWNDYMRKHPHAEGHEVMEAYGKTLSAGQGSGDSIRIDEDHPILAAILKVRHRNACNFAPSHSGSLGEARDDTLLEIYRDVETLLKSGGLTITSLKSEAA